MIAATPTGWTRSEYELTDPEGTGAPFGEISLRVFGSGRLTIGALDFDVETSHWTKTTYALVHGQERLAVAERPSLWRRRTRITVDPELAEGTAGLEFDLEPVGWLGREWVLLAGRLEVGHAVWARVVKGRLDADLSEALPLAVQAFVVAVLVCERRRQGRQAS